MSLIVSLTIASALGTLLGNMGLFWIIGNMAQRQEQKQKEELSKLQAAFLEARHKEAERMQRYAKLEG